MKRILTKWWFYPAVAAYLLFGLWFGSLNYKVHQNPESRSYVLRFILYPVTTVFREGWICLDSVDSPDCVIQPSRKSMTFSYNALGLLRDARSEAHRSEAHVKAVYLTMLTVGWPAKVAFNAVLIFVIYALTFVSGMLLLLVAAVSWTLYGLYHFLGLLL